MCTVPRKAEIWKNMLMQDRAIFQRFGGQKSKVETDINLTRQRDIAQAWKKLQLMTKKTYVSVQAVQIRLETQYPKTHYIVW